MAVKGVKNTVHIEQVYTVLIVFTETQQQRLVAVARKNFLSEAETSSSSWWAAIDLQSIRNLQGEKAPGWKLRAMCILGSKKNLSRL